MLNTQIIKSVFEKSGFTKSQVAKSADLTRPTLDAILDGCDVRVSSLEKYARFFELSPGYFFEGDNNPEGKEGKVSSELFTLRERIKLLEEIVKQQERVIMLYEKFNPDVKL